MVFTEEAMITSEDELHEGEGLMVATTGASRHGAFAGRAVCGAVMAAMLAQTAAIRPAMAQEEPSSAETAAARGLAVEGLKLADSGRCVEAVDKLLRAEKLHHSAIVQGRLGECQIALGKLVDGTENLRKVLREPASNPSPALVKARERAQTALDGAKPKIAFLMISVKGPKELGSATVTVDGESVPPALLDADRPTDPGDHVIEASAPGYLKASARVSVKEAERKAVSVRLDADPNAVLPATAPSAAEPAGGSPHMTPREPTSSVPPRDTRFTAGADSGGSTSSAPNRTGAYIAWAVGGVALAVGAGFGAVAMKKKNDLDANCKANVCGSSQSDALSDGKTAGNVSTAGFIVGGVGLALGTVLFFTASPSNSGSTGNLRTAGGVAPRPRETGLAAMQPRAFIGIGQVSLAGSF
jgi:hypothetical protein